MPIGSLIVLAACAAGKASDRDQLLWGNWASTPIHPDVSVTFKNDHTYSLLTDRKGEDYVEHGRFTFKKNLITFYVQKSVVNVTPPGPPKIGVPFPQRPVPSLHGQTWTLKIHWIDRHHFKGSDGRIYTARMQM